MNKLKINTLLYHIGYWIFVVSVLLMIFGHSWDNKLYAFYFISLLLPVIMASSYFFNYYLVPKYLLKKKYWQFILFFAYSVIVSLFLEMIVITLTFVYLLQYHLDNFSPNSKDTLLLGIVLYLVVFLSSFLLMFKQLKDSQKEISELQEKNKKFKKSFLQLTSQRKSVKIPYEEINYIESLSDYIKVYTTTNEAVISKIKISKIEQVLPDNFLRIHRSFIINTEKMSSFDYNEVEVNNTLLTIGRTYKKVVLLKLKRAGDIRM